MSTPWLHIVGVTEAGIAALPPHERELVDSAEKVLGPERLVAGLSNAEYWTPPFEVMLKAIDNRRGKPTVILATGDPNWFGIGATLSRRMEPEEFEIHPATSSVQLAAAKLKWPLQNVTTLSLHGRDPEALHSHLLPGNRILALTSDAATFVQVAGILEARGYGGSVLTILENLGGAGERNTECTAASASRTQIGDFYVLAIDCVADQGTPLLPPIPGLPDDAFANDGQLTKRDVRAATLAKLAPCPGALLWDVGAGCGSVAIEWMRAARNARALCFERDKERIGMIDRNRRELGVPGLETVKGEAPQTLADQPAPDAVFLGGDVANDALFEACWQALKPQGRLVANAVTPDGEAALFRRHEGYGGELTRIDIAVLDKVGFAPRRTVTQWAVTKKGAAQ